MLPGNFGPQWVMMTAPRLPTACAPALAGVSRGKCRLGQQRLASFGPGPGRWADSQHSMPVPGNLAVAGQESTVGLPRFGAICGSQVSFMEKHPHRKVWRGCCHTSGHFRRVTQESENSLGSGQGLQVPEAAMGDYTSPHSIKFPVLGGFTSLGLVFFTCPQSSLQSIGPCSPADELTPSSSSGSPGHILGIPCYPT